MVSALHADVARTAWGIQVAKVLLTLSAVSSGADHQWSAHYMQTLQEQRVATQVKGIGGEVVTHSHNISRLLTCSDPM